MVIMPSLLGWYWNELILNAMWGSFLITMAIAIYLQNPLQIICAYAIRFIMDTPEYRTGLTPPIKLEGYMRYMNMNGKRRSILCISSLVL